jgi:DnaK suppressor protein
VTAAAVAATAGKPVPATPDETVPGQRVNGRGTAQKSAQKSAVRPTAKSGARSAAKAAPPIISPASGQYAEIHSALEERLRELQAEYDQTMADLTDLQRDRISDNAGDDQADTGTKTFEREQELSLANGILDRIGQVEHALARLDAGTYGRCERCGNEIPKARLEAFPSVTLCVTCKQLEERR